MGSQRRCAQQVMSDRVRRWVVVIVKDVSSEHRLLCAALIIDSADKRVVIFPNGIAVYGFAARIGSGREFADKGYGWFTEERRIDSVVGEWRLQRNLPAGITGRRSECREISRQHCGCRNK